MRAHRDSMSADRTIGPGAAHEPGPKGPGLPAETRRIAAATTDACRLVGRDSWTGAYARALVQARQRFASSGIVSPQNGQGLVGAPASGLITIRTIMNTTKATIAKSMAVPMKAP